MDDLDRDLRGAGHGPDHEFVLKTLRRVVCRVRNRSGYRERVGRL